MGESRNRFVYLSSAIAAINGALFGYDTGIISGALPYIKKDFALSSSGGWRRMLGLGALPALALGIGMLVMPESPRWLVAQDREEAAREVLLSIVSSGDPGEEIRNIREAARKESGRVSELLKGWMRPALVVGLGLAVFQQITGVNTVIYYAPTIFHNTGFGNSASILGTVGVVNVLLTVAAILLVDRVGRRPLLLVGLVGMVLSLAGLAFLLPALSGVVGWIAIVSLMFYIAFFAVGMGPVFWLLISEIYPLEVRGAAMGVASVGNWASNLLVSLTFLTLSGLSDGPSPSGSTRPSGSWRSSSSGIWYPRRRGVAWRRYRTCE